MEGVQLEEDRQHERRRRHEHGDQGEGQDQAASVEPPDCETVAGRNPRHEGQGCRAEGVDQRVHDPAAVEVVAERVELMPRDDDGVQASEGKRRTGDERVVRPRRCEQEPEQRDGEEEREGNEHERANGARKAAGMSLTNGRDRPRGRERLRAGAPPPSAPPREPPGLAGRRARRSARSGPRSGRPHTR
jgi:hypothetical protein